MSRMVKDFCVNGDMNALCTKISDLLAENGYKFITRGNENIFNNKHISFKFSVYGNLLRKETWYTEEILTNGLEFEYGYNQISLLKKKKWILLDKSIETAVTEFGGQPVKVGFVQAPPNAVPYPQQGMPYQQQGMPYPQQGMPYPQQNVFACPVCGAALVNGVCAVCGFGVNR